METPSPAATPPEMEVDNPTVETIPKPLPDLPAELESEAEFSMRWEVKSWLELCKRSKIASDSKVWSDPFSLGGVQWRVLIFPLGNSCEFVSLYLDLADADKVIFQIK
jgi:hypothetical protein